MPALKSIAPLVAVSLRTILLLSGCVYSRRIGATTPCIGNGIVIACQSTHARLSVGLWTDPGGYDAQRVERRFAAFEQSEWQNTQEEGKAREIPYCVNRCPFFGADQLADEVRHCLRTGRETDPVDGEL